MLMGGSHGIVRLFIETVTDRGRGLEGFLLSAIIACTELAKFVNGRLCLRHLRLRVEHHAIFKIANDFLLELLVLILFLLSAAGGL